MHGDFARQAGLSSEETEEMIDVLESMGAEVRSISAAETARRLDQPALFIHSCNDRIVPIADGLECASAWPGARLLQLEGLGHGRILRASIVLEAIVKFIAA
jgi:pimeloyl-ACP methyl ester carboxylesterase